MSVKFKQISAKYQGQNGWAESPAGKHKRKNKKEDPQETNEEIMDGNGTSMVICSLRW